MFDYKRWTNAAPKLLLIKYSMKREIAAVNSNCPEAKKIDNLSMLDNARGTASSFLKKVTEAQGALAKLKLKDKGAEDLLKLWVKTIKTYTANLDKQERVLIAEVNKKRVEDEAEKQKIVDEIRGNMERVAELYVLARKHAAVALQLRQKKEETKAANHIIKSFRQIHSKMNKEGQSAFRKYKAEEKNLTAQQKKTVMKWLKGEGKYAQMAGPVKKSLDDLMNSSSFPDLKKLFPPPPKL